MAAPATPAPPIETVVETAVYAADLNAAENFYTTVLGLTKVGHEAGRHLFFRVGSASLLLVFNADATMKGGPFPAHGATGPGHFALGIPTDSLDAWRDHLIACGVVIEQEMTWPLSGRSIYFRDPVGNSVELVTRGVWGTPAGW
jgi:catechol 2,3-dioxygenase-like lactoylglutathione lyase family enzyme